METKANQNSDYRTYPTQANSSGGATDRLQRSEKIGITSYKFKLMHDLKTYLEVTQILKWRGFWRNFQHLENIWIISWNINMFLSVCIVCRYGVCLTNEKCSSVQGICFSSWFFVVK